VCRDCRELYTDVRATLLALGAVSTDDPVSLDGLNARILAATTAGEMLSCNEFDRLIERYFDGVLLAPTFQTFQAHFEKCAKCRRLMAGIEEAIEICHEIKETEVDAPPSLQDRILAATVGPRKTSLLRHWKELLFGVLLNAGRALRTPQWVAALLIFAAACLLIVSRFGSISAMANHATSQAGQLHQKMIVTSTNALNGLEHIEAFFSGEEQAKPPGITQPQPSPTLQPATASSPSGDSQLQQPVRHAPLVRRSQHRK
jgi:hypothetical protein